VWRFGKGFVVAENEWKFLKDRKEKQNKERWGRGLER
jgi:hypothetical protein